VFAYWFNSRAQSSVKRKKNIYATSPTEIKIKVLAKTESKKRITKTPKLTEIKYNFILEYIVYYKT